MTYELINKTISAERTIMQDIVELIDDVETITGQEETDDYEVTITLGLHTEDDLVPNFSKDIIVRSSNAQTGFEVDAQRDQAVADFIASINE